MQIRIGICGEIVVDRQVDALNIDTTSENVGSDTNSLVKFLKLFISLNPIRLSAIYNKFKCLRSAAYRSSWLTPE